MKGWTRWWGLFHHQRTDALNYSIMPSVLILHLAGFYILSSRCSVLCSVCSGTNCSAQFSAAQFSTAQFSTAASAASLIINLRSKHGISRWIFHHAPLLPSSPINGVKPIAQWGRVHLQMATARSAASSAAARFRYCSAAYQHNMMINATQGKSRSASKTQKQQSNKQGSNSHKMWEYV